MSLSLDFSTLVSRLESVTARLAVVEKQLAEGGGSSSSTGGSESNSASVQDYEELINRHSKSYIDLSSKLGDKVVIEQAKLVLDAVNAQKELLKIAATSKKPSDEQFQKLLEPTSTLMQKIIGLKDSNRGSKFFNNLSAVADGIQVLGWVVISPTPGPYVGEMRGGSELYSNRILKEFKGTSNQNQVDWANTFNSFLKELQDFIKKHHTTGLQWNSKGGDAPKVVKVSSSSEDSAPPPPGPAPPPPPPSMDFESGGDQPDMSNVFKSISKGEGVTSGLRKVTDDMKAKNRKDKTSVVPASVTKEVKKEATKEVAKKPPKLTLEGSKWVVEYQVGNKNIVISDTEPKQTCYIYRCSNSTVQIQGKINAITLDDCTKVAVVFENVVASFEAVNCRSIEVQVTGRVPSIAIDKTSGCQIYLGKSALDTEIVTSKSSEMNVLIPSSDPDQDMIEMAIPEQYKTMVKNNKLVTEIVQHV